MAEQTRSTTDGEEAEIERTLEAMRKDASVERESAPETIPCRRCGTPLRPKEICQRCKKEAEAKRAEGVMCLCGLKLRRPGRCPMCGRHAFSGISTEIPRRDDPPPRPEPEASVVSEKKPSILERMYRQRKKTMPDPTPKKSEGLGSCPKCGTPYGKRRRCFRCQPGGSPRNREPSGSATPPPEPATLPPPPEPIKATTADPSDAMSVLDSVELVRDSLSPCPVEIQRRIVEVALGITL